MSWSWSPAAGTLGLLLSSWDQGHFARLDCYVQIGLISCLRMNKPKLVRLRREGGWGASSHCTVLASWSDTAVGASQAAQSPLSMTVMIMIPSSWHSWTRAQFNVNIVIFLRSKPHCLTRLFLSSVDRAEWFPAWVLLALTSNNSGGQIETSSGNLDTND